MLSSGARRSEIHALDVSRVGWSKNQEKVTLRPNLGFMAKNHVARDPATAFQGFTIKAMAPSVPESDIVICPVRALRIYLERTKHARSGESQRLFLPIRDATTSSGGVCANTISSWMSHTILEAYKYVEHELDVLQLCRARSHEIRAFNASWQALHNVSVGDIMKSCRWKSVTTFADFYLRDMVVLEKGLYAFEGLRESFA